MLETLYAILLKSLKDLYETFFTSKVKEINKGVA